ncbi:MAG: hypothetical protein ACRDSJ_15475 [Rubrobacteraceae bacterium]
MNDNIQLTVGQQTAAANLIEERMADLEKLLTTLSGNIESAVPGMMGSAAGGLVESLQTWYEKVGGLGTLMQDYAAALRAVDVQHATTQNEIVHEAHGQATNLQQRLGPQG